MKRTILISIIIIGWLALNDSYGQSGIGKLSYEISDRDLNKSIPAKLVFFKEKEEYQLGISSKGEMAVSKNVLYTGTGRGEISLPIGIYEIWIGRGMEYSAAVQTVEILQGELVHLNVQLIREVNTEGFVAGDMHLHTLTYSGHGDTNVEERIISCVAEGLEWIVATDHNHVTDYAPVKKTLKLSTDISTTRGNEVSTSIGHFNAYPLNPASSEISAAPKDARKLFSSMRQSTSDAMVVQVNHPRWPHSDYFNVLDLDEYFTISSLEEFSWDFDAIEVLNENQGIGWFEKEDNTSSVKVDWYNILNTGRKVTALGNSDSHSVTKMIPGMPRNYIRSSTDDPAQISEAEMVSSIKSQQVSVSKGIFVDLNAGDQSGIGSQVSTKEGKVDLHIKVQAARWIDCDTVQLVGNGHVLETFVVNTTDQVIRFDEIVTVMPEIDTWYIVIAKGTRPMSPLVADAPIPITPLGFTNPIWVDADGDGKFTPAKGQAIAMMKKYRRKPEDLKNKLIEYPEVRPHALLALIREEKPNQDLILALLQQLDLRQRLAVYSRVGIFGDDKALVWLNEIGKPETFLEELGLELARVALNASDQPLRMSHEELVFTRRVFRNYFIGSLTSQWEVSGPLSASQQISFSIDGRLSNEVLHAQNADSSNEWFKTVVNRNGQVSGPEMEKGSDKNLLARTILFSQYTDELRLVVENVNKIWVNGKRITFTSESNTTSVQDKFVTISFGRGANEVVLQVDAGEKFIAAPIDFKGLINEELANKKVRKHLAFGKETKLKHEYHLKYDGGEMALTDGVWGSISFNDGFWQGFEEEDFETIIDLEEPQMISAITARFLHSIRDWIFAPNQVSFSVSSDGSTYQLLGVEERNFPLEEKSNLVFESKKEALNTEARYIKVKAKNIGSCPDWHDGAGGKAWLFIDEIIVE